jgi:hypothetical protein
MAGLKEMISSMNFLKGANLEGRFKPDKVGKLNRK